MAKKYLGQHFLTDDTVSQKIIEALEISSGETIIEIGPGKGALTFPLEKVCQNKGATLVGIEKDMEFKKELKNINIIFGDVLEKLPEMISPPYKIVGNIPYYLTGKLLRLISKLDPLPKRVVLMVQKEVAERISYTPPKINLLSAATQFWAKPSLLFIVKKDLFEPTPKVDSAVISLKSKPVDDLNPNIYYPFIHILFKQPRKTLLNNLTSGLSLSKEEIKVVLARNKLSESLRPQNLTLKNIKNLASEFSQQLGIGN